MFLKIKNILIMLSIFTLLQAKAMEKPYVKVSLYHSVLSISASDGGKKTWVGIYKVGTSTEWSNVKGWTWVKDHPFGIKVDELSPGKYEARLFYNNSYKMEAKTTFTIKAPTTKPFIKLTKKNGNASIDVSHSVAPKAWIGIYPVGSSNSWGNVKSWKWAEKDGTTNIPVSFLKRGKYEARLFYNNSYKLEAKFTFGPMGGGPAGERSAITKDINLYIDLKHIGYINMPQIGIEPVGASNEKQWIGVYKKGTIISERNLVAKCDIPRASNYCSLVRNRDSFGDDTSYDIVYHPTSNFIYAGERKSLNFVKPKLGMEYGHFRNPTARLVINKTLYNKVKKPLDWVGIFKNNAEITKENLLDSAYMKDINRDGSFNFKEYRNTNHKLVLFSENSYKILSISTVVDYY